MSAGSMLVSLVFIPSSSETLTTTLGLVLDLSTTIQPPYTSLYLHSLNRSLAFSTDVLTGGRLRLSQSAGENAGGIPGLRGTEVAYINYPLLHLKE